VSELSKLDDPDYPAYTIGQAAELLSVQQAFLRSLDTADVVSPYRSAGGHRRYSRRQLELVSRLREQLDNGHTLSAASHILDLENELAATRDDLAEARSDLQAARQEISDLRAQLARVTGQAGQESGGEASAGSEDAAEHRPDDEEEEEGRR
jgi:DNA-binding transcriptional MerR regulator